MINWSIFGYAMGSFKMKLIKNSFEVLRIRYLIIIVVTVPAALADYVIRRDHLHREPGQVRLNNRVIYLTTVVPAAGVIAVFFAYKHHPLIGISG